MTDKLICEIPDRWASIRYGVKIPLFSPKLICYKFEGESQQCIKGDSYAVVTNTPYIFSEITFNWHYYQQNPGCTPNILRIYRTDLPLNLSYPLQSQGYTGTGQGASCLGWTRTYFNWIDNNNNPGQILIPQANTVTSGVSGAELLSIQQLEYTINIFDEENNLVHTDTGVNNPIVNVFNNICRGEGYKSVRFKNRYRLKGAAKIYVRKDKFVVGKSRICLSYQKPNNPLYNIACFDVDSECLDDADIVVRCLYQDPGKCPPNTFSCDNGVWRCCYNCKSGKLIKRIPLVPSANSRGSAIR